MIMDCKVKIGVSYEPKWFERRYTQGTYSAKGIAHDEETIWLQQALLSRSFKRKGYAGWIFSAAVVVGLFLFSYGV
jgi:hypothetical protein